jgi:glutamate-1-semialdehyde 2,1-aminomutase
MTLGIPNSPGVPDSVAADTLVARYNDLDSVDRLLALHPGQVAAVVVEPVAGNMGVVAPEDGFLQGLRNLARTHGTLLVCDEVITGFRVRYGAVQDRYGVSADLTLLGKIVGGGLPLAAVGGRADLMDQLAPQGPVYQAGTLSGNPLAVAAGLETLEHLAKPGVYDRLEQLGRRLQDGLEAAVLRRGLSGCVNRVGSMMTFFPGVRRVRNADEAGGCDAAFFARYFHGMLARGVYLPPSAFEALFLSLAHSDDEIDLTIHAASETLASI